MNIRNYIESDKPYLQTICIETSSKAKVDPIHKQFTVNFYCNLYLDFEYVKVLEDKHPVGYLFVALDYNQYIKHLDKILPVIPESYLDRIKNEIQIFEKYQHDYPAHLHIDLLPTVQKGGNGSRLMTEVLKELEEMNIKGIMLGVAKTNILAIHFYEKFGFKRLEENEGGFIYGLKICS